MDASLANMRAIEPNQEEINNLFYSFYNLTQVDLDLEEWIIKAKKERFCIDEKIKKLRQILEDMPAISESELHFSTGITLVYQVKMRQIVLAEIIQSYTINYIELLYKQGREKLESNPTKLLRLQQCYIYIQKKIPLLSLEKIILLPPQKAIQNAKIIQEKCKCLISETNDMRTKFYQR